MRFIPTITFLLILATQITTSQIYAQTPVGYLFDVNGMPLDGSIDPFSYAPHKKAKKTSKAWLFEEGHYYDSFGRKKEGFIKHGDSRLLFKEDETQEHPYRIEPEDIQAAVIGIDSFLVITDFFYDGTTYRKPHLARFMSQSNGTTFLMYYKLPITQFGTTILAKGMSDLEWESLNSKEKDFNQVIAKYFSHIPYVIEKQRKDELSEKDLISLIKMSEYYEKSLKGQKINFNKYWTEIEYNTNSSYQAQVKQIQDSIWTLEYLKMGKKIYEVSYSSFYPHTKNGPFIEFNENGSIRKQTEFVNNKPLHVMVYNQNNTIQYSYDLMYDKRSGEKQNTRIHYTIVNDEQGRDLMKGQLNFIETRHDPINGRTYEIEYQNGEIVSSSFDENGKSIYQMTNPKNKIDITELKSHIRNLSDDNLAETVKDGAKGTILVSFIVNEKGYVEKYSILNELHEELNQNLDRLLTEKCGWDDGFNYKLKPYKVQKNKVNYEVIVPVNFSNNKFKVPTSYDYDGSPWDGYNYHQYHFHMPYHFTPAYQNITVPQFNMPSHF